MILRFNWEMVEETPTKGRAGVSGRSTSDQQGITRRGKLSCVRHKTMSSNQKENRGVESKLVYDKKLDCRPSVLSSLLMWTYLQRESYPRSSRSCTEPVPREIAIETAIGAWLSAIRSFWSDYIGSMQLLRYDTNTITSKLAFESVKLSVTRTLVLCISCVSTVAAISNEQAPWSTVSHLTTASSEVVRISGQNHIEEDKSIVPAPFRPDRFTQESLVSEQETSIIALANTVASLKTPPVGNSATLASRAATWPLPIPFDVGFSHNITSKCQDFMTGMIENPTFKQCTPVSMVLQNSKSFFQTSKYHSQITSLLDSACAASVSSCTSLLNSYAQNLTSSKTCAVDLLHANPQIESALLGLKSYQTLYTATCLRSPDTKININQKHPHAFDAARSDLKPVNSSYCFADAITNVTNPANSYIYYLPLNVSLIGSAVPTCNGCLQSTMAVFQQATSSRSSVIAGNYVEAATQVNVVCGPQFVNASLVAAISSANLKYSSHSIFSRFGLIWLILALMGWCV